MRHVQKSSLWRSARLIFSPSFRGRVVRRGSRGPLWVQYDQQLIGVYRAAAASGQYELYVGVDSDPDFTAAPAQTSATLPFSYPVVAPGVGTKEYRLCVRWRDEYGVLGLNQHTQKFTLNAGGGLVTPDPSGPEDVQLVELPNLYLGVFAKYRYLQDGSNRADYWDVYSKVGADPVPGVDSPVAVAMASYYSCIPLRYEAGAYDFEDEVHVIVRCRRDSDDADDGNTTVYTHTMSTQLSSPAYGRAFQGDVFLVPVP